MFKAIGYVFERFVLRRSYLNIKAKPFGLRFRVRAEDVVGRRIYKSGIYEEELTNFVMQTIRLRDDDIAIDIGANIGWYSLLFSRLAGKDQQVFAFEPDALNFELLSHNVALNGVDNIHLENIAISDSVGQQNLYRYNSNNFGRHSLLPLNDEDVVTVKTTTLDTYFSREDLRHCTVRVLKVDIEGYEYQAFLGAADILRRTETLIMEFSPQCMRDYSIDPQLLVQLLQDRGFMPFQLASGELQPVDPGSLVHREDQLNLVWKKAGPTN